MKTNTLVIGAFMTDPLYLADNVVMPCAECHRMIQVRPHARDLANHMICMECAKSHIEDGAELVTTRRMLDDAAAYFRRKTH